MYRGFFRVRLQDLGELKMYKYVLTACDMMSAKKAVEEALKA